MVDGVVPIKFTFVEKGKNQERTVYVQKGMVLNFSETNSIGNNNSNFKIGNDGKVYQNGKVVDGVKLTKDQLATIQALSRLDKSDGQHEFTLTQKDVDEASINRNGAATGIGSILGFIGSSKHISSDDIFNQKVNGKSGLTIKLQGKDMSTSTVHIQNQK